MKIIPAIDILDGKCVRLYKGDFNKVTTYSDDPVEQVKRFMDEGFTYIHIIDLDAALSGECKNLKLIETVAKITGLKIQVGGGIRSIERIKNLFSTGVDRLIVGTAAITDKDFRNNIYQQVNYSKIVFGLDFKITNNQPMLFDYINNNKWIKNVLATDISKDGTLDGPNINIYKQLLLNKNINLTASGGIGCLDDIKNLIDIGSQECVVGKAIYENKILLKDLLNAN
jgi:phosphoribosylformimino-5-aminoimidazole carboxamide ribotide isomerase